MPLLSFKYLPLRGAQIQALRIDWAAHKAWVECLLTGEGRLARTTIEFSGIRTVTANLTTADAIVRCVESQGIFTLRSAGDDLLTVQASQYTVL